MVIKIKTLYYGAAATTAIAGILHLIQGSNVLGFNLNFGIFFIVSGLAQLFWVLPIIRRWGLPWYYVGIGGTIVLIILFEVLQVAFIGFTVAIIVYERKRKQLSGKTATEIA